jgi:hypothetical protein
MIHGRYEHKVAREGQAAQGAADGGYNVLM